MPTTHRFRNCNLEICGSKNIGDSPPFTAISSPGVGHRVEKTESEYQLLPLAEVPIVEIPPADGGRSLGGQDLVHIGLH